MTRCACDPARFNQHSMPGECDGGVWEVSGVVTAPDGSEYQPLFYGDEQQARTVFDAVRAGALDRGEGIDLVLIDGAGATVRHWYRPVPVRGRVMVEAVGGLELGRPIEEVI